MSHVAVSRPPSSSPYRSAAVPRLRSRTLTIMERKSGVSLIIQNKRFKKSRVLIKRVPQHVSEINLRTILEDSFGPLQVLFQLRTDDPVCGSIRRPREPKYLTYSAFFLNHKDAKKLLHLGSIAFEDGSVVTIHKHSEGSRPKEKIGGDLQFGCPPREFSHGTELKGEQQTRTFGSLAGQEIFGMSHHLKPTHRLYYGESDVGNLRKRSDLYDNKFQYRLNREPRITLGNLW